MQLTVGPIDFDEVPQIWVDQSNAHTLDKPFLEKQNSRNSALSSYPSKDKWILSLYKWPYFPLVSYLRLNNDFVAYLYMYYKV